MANVLVVEQHPRGRLAELLGAEGFEVSTLGSTDALEPVIRRATPDLVVLEVGVASDATASTVDRIARACPSPVLVVCQACEEGDLLAAYAAGAASVLTDATGPREIVARSRALVRRGALDVVPNDDRIVVGPIVLDRARRQLTVSGRLVRLPRREFDIAEALMRRAGTVVTRRHLLMELWGGAPRDSKTLDVQVGRLRARLAAAEGQRRILTVRGVGYRFVTDDDLARGVLVGSERDGERVP